MPKVGASLAWVALIGLVCGLYFYVSNLRGDDNASQLAAPPVAKPATAKFSIEVPETGTGQFDVIPGTVNAPDARRQVTFRVKIEKGLSDVIGDASEAFADTVHRTLNHPRSWGQGSRIAFVRTDGDADLDVILATPGTTNTLCKPLRTLGRLSCHQDGKVVLNVRRWMTATSEFDDLQLYRQYLVNHEVGHFLGNGHQKCPGAGKPAPVMQPQTKRVAPCVPNAWPHP